MCIMLLDLIHFLTNVFSHVCHQIPDRSFNFLVFGGKSILCARCFGMYLGLLFGITLSFLVVNIKNTILIKMLFVSVIILIIEIIVEKIVILTYGNAVRLMTGIIFGMSVGIGTITPIKGGFK